MAKSFTPRVAQVVAALAPLVRLGWRAHKNGESVWRPAASFTFSDKGVTKALEKLEALEKEARAIRAEKAPAVAMAFTKAGFMPEGYKVVVSLDRTAKVTFGIVPEVTSGGDMGEVTHL